MAEEHITSELPTDASPSGGAWPGVESGHRPRSLLGDLALFVVVSTLAAGLAWAFLTRATPQQPPGNQEPVADRPVAIVDSPAVAAPLSADAIFAQASPAVVQVVTQDRQGHTIGTGSGFVASSGGLIATNHHVIDGAYSAYVALADKRRLPVSGAAALDPDADLAILQAAGPVGARHLELAGDTLPPVGARVYAIGNPLGLTRSLSDGLVSGHRERGTIPDFPFPRMPTLIQMTAPISPGSSGGPLLRADGKVVGVTTLVSVQGQNLNLAVPAWHVARLLRQHDEERILTRLPLARRPAAGQPPSDPDEKSKKDAQAVELIRKFLVPGMTSSQVATVVEVAVKELGIPVRWREQQTAPRVWVVRYFPYEGRRGPGLTGLRFRLHVKYVNDRLTDWNVEEN
jgi:S1-C subfamily serine protease